MIDIKELQFILQVVESLEPIANDEVQTINKKMAIILLRKMIQEFRKLH